jgi:hypothetical protein
MEHSVVVFFAFVWLIVIVGLFLIKIVSKSSVRDSVRARRQNLIAANRRDLANAANNNRNRNVIGGSTNAGIPTHVADRLESSGSENSNKEMENRRELLRSHLELRQISVEPWRMAERLSNLEQRIKEKETDRQGDEETGNTAAIPPATETHTITDVDLEDYDPPISSRDADLSGGSLRSTSSTSLQSLVSFFNRVFATERDLRHQECCSICLDSYVVGDTVARLKRDSHETESHCNHWFHEDCILQWLETHQECPLCRVDMIHR